MSGIIRVYQAKRYLGGFSTRRSLIWIATTEGLNGEKRQVTNGQEYIRVLKTANSESDFTGFPVSIDGRQESEDQEVRE